MPSPTVRQLQYLRQLALRAGQSFLNPRTAAEASTEICRLRATKPSSRIERLVETRSVQYDMAERPDDATAIRDHEIKGYASTAAWSASAGEDPGPRAVHCKREHFDVYVGRASHDMPGSKWGNPFVEGRHGSREQCIEKYRERVMRSPELLGSLEELRGKRLGCWCAPRPCHADVLVELANATRERQREWLSAAEATQLRPGRQSDAVSRETAAPTSAQLRYLEQLTARAGEQFDPPPSKAAASREIERLRTNALRGRSTSEIHTAASSHRSTVVARPATRDAAMPNAPSAANQGVAATDVEHLGESARLVGRYSVPQGGERVLVATKAGDHFAVSDQPAALARSNTRGFAFPVVPRVSESGLSALAADYIADAKRLGAIPMACSQGSAYSPQARPSAHRERDRGAQLTAYERAREREQRALAEHALARSLADAERERSTATRMLRRSPTDPGIEPIGL